MDRYGGLNLESFEMSPMSPGMRHGSSNDEMIHPCSGAEELQYDNKDIQIDVISINNRTKDMRAFKFILVEYLKDLINPYWKQDKIARYVYKMILKKSADQVIKSFGQKNFPTGRKIDLYIQSSHSKLAHLIEMYVRVYGRN
ncbi:hypothetical protein ABFS83_08G094700 [Erythranthe nasuta]